MVACGCMTTPADVAAFTGHYLADSARTRQEMVRSARSPPRVIASAVVVRR